MPAPRVIASSLPHDDGGIPDGASVRYFSGPWNAATDTGLAQRGSNVSGAYADSNVVLYDAAGNPLVFDTGGKARVSLYGKSSAAGDTVIDATTADADAVSNTVNALRTSSRLYGYSTSGWDRLRAGFFAGLGPSGFLSVAMHMLGTGALAQVQKTAKLLSSGNDGEGLAGHAAYSRFADTNWYPSNGMNFNADAIAATMAGQIVGSFGHSWSGNDWERDRGNLEGGLLSSASRVGQIVTATQTNPSNHRLLLALHCSTWSGTTSFNLQLIWPMPGSGQSVFYTASGPMSPGGSGGVIVLVVALGAVSADHTPAGVVSGVVAKSAMVPRSWSVAVTPTDAASNTYSLAYALGG